MSAHLYLIHIELTHVGNINGLAFSGYCKIGCGKKSPARCFFYLKKDFTMDFIKWVPILENHALVVQVYNITTGGNEVNDPDRSQAV